MQPQRDQSMVWTKPNEPGPSIPMESMHGGKRMLLMAMDFEGIAWYHLCEENETINADRYKTILEREIPKWLRERRIIEWKQPAYSPDISCCDYGCFGPLKRELRSGAHANWSEFENHLKEVIEEGRRNGHYLAVQQLPERWDRVIKSEGEYI
ncbi:hypothetical protein FO519_009429 [Halicephalobus sp. NKZ332]|nr:hypothetical protein FO519_009429 [Halicephalobus sp. NKZ332]